MILRMFTLFVIQARIAYQAGSYYNRTGLSGYHHFYNVASFLCPATTMFLQATTIPHGAQSTSISIRLIIYEEI